MAGLVGRVMPSRDAALIIGCLTLSACASNKELFAEYDENFCPAVEGVPVVIEKLVEKEVIRDKLVVKEVPAASIQLPWEPAVYFDSNSTSLGEPAVESLNHNVRFLEKFTLYQVSIRGFTDQHASVD
ncbi:MAG: hypothetical protein AAF404_00235, partial [Pseudomonadota bacterium]